LRSGLCPNTVEAELERRAQVYALSRTKWPLLALAQAAGGLPEGGNQRGEVHARGFALLVRDLAKLARNHPSLGKEENVVAALYRLSPRMLSRFAGKVKQQMGLVPFRVGPGP